MELHQQIRTPEQLLSIVEIKTAGKKNNQNSTEQSIC